MDTHYHDGEDNDAKPAADNPSQQNNLQPLQEDLGNEAMLDQSNEEGDQLDLSARLKIASIDLPLRNASVALLVKDQTDVSNQQQINNNNNNDEHNINNNEEHESSADDTSSKANGTTMPNNNSASLQQTGAKEDAG